ncbi:aldo/keto reductase [Nocardiopsis sp. CNR-923]|uniref:aldo/keto reductase n=1 Tax=Nocardiopsis sp. CNR-923 TaxID=1904965 RepID=UPI0021CC6F10|nr:aldo/keto reductase [Nocardiopsis sp. CNR-923]
MTGLDTAYNYQHFSSHQALAAAAGEALDEFEITTKVGFFPQGHDLSPERLRQAVRQTVDDLGRVPDTVLLHNPECSVDGFEAACEALVRIRDDGLCREWGISTWSPQELVGRSWALPPPDVIMVRAGLSVPAPVLDATERLTIGLGAKKVYGMAPFGGNANDPIWSKVDTHLFLTPGQQAHTLQAALAAAFAIPEVERIAVGTSSPTHLAHIVQARSLTISPAVIERYRALLRARTERNPTG